MNPIGSNTSKYKAGDSCKFHDPDKMMSFCATFMGVHGNNVYIVLHDGSYNKIPLSWLS